MNNKTSIQPKTVYLLIGQKGSGKSFIGTIMDRDFGIKFIRVEDWAKQIKQDRPIDHPSYLSEVFRAIENGVRSSLNDFDTIVFESTGLTANFDRMLQNLRNDFNVVTIRIHADSQTCLQRVRTRDQSIHINVSDEQVNYVNREVQRREIVTDYCINNENKTETELKQEIYKIRNQVS